MVPHLPDPILLLAGWCISGFLGFDMSGLNSRVNQCSTEPFLKTHLGISQMAPGCLSIYTNSTLKNTRIKGGLFNSTFRGPDPDRKVYFQV